MDHWQIHGIDLDGSVELFTKVLGFGISERLMDGDRLLAAFLSCSTKPHDIAFIRERSNRTGSASATIQRAWKYRSAIRKRKNIAGRVDGTIPGSKSLDHNALANLQRAAA